MLGYVRPVTRRPGSRRRAYRSMAPRPRPCRPSHPRRATTVWSCVGTPRAWHNLCGPLPPHARLLRTTQRPYEERVSVSCIAIGNKSSTAAACSLAARSDQRRVPRATLLEVAWRRRPRSRYGLATRRPPPCPKPRSSLESLMGIEPDEETDAGSHRHGSVASHEEPSSDRPRRRHAPVPASRSRELRVLGHVSWVGEHKLRGRHARSSAVVLAHVQKLVDLDANGRPNEI